jgi:hypothetical protein
VSKDEEEGADGVKSLSRGNKEAGHELDVDDDDEVETDADESEEGTREFSDRVKN